MKLYYTWEELRITSPLQGTTFILEGSLIEHTFYLSTFDRTATFLSLLSQKSYIKMVNFNLLLYFWTQSFPFPHCAFSDGKYEVWYGGRGEWVNGRGERIKKWVGEKGEWYFKNPRWGLRRGYFPLYSWQLEFFLSLQEMKKNNFGKEIMKIGLSTEITELLINKYAEKTGIEITDLLEEME